MQWPLLAVSTSRSGAGTPADTAPNIRCATDIAHLLAQRMLDVPQLRVLIVTPKMHSSWFESQAMQSGRGGFIGQFVAAGVMDRIRFLYPSTRDAGEAAAVMVHSKVMIVDDRILRAEFAHGHHEVDLGGLIDAEKLLPVRKGYFHYSGSLTTPPCSEGVRWFVMKEPIFVSSEAIANLRNTISHFPNYNHFNQNNRPVMPLNGRAVLSRMGIGD